MVRKIVVDRRSMGLGLFSSPDDGQTWREEIRLESPLPNSEAGARPAHTMLPDGRILVVFLATNPEPDKSHPAWPYISGGFIAANIICPRPSSG